MAEPTEVTYEVEVPPGAKPGNILEMTLPNGVKVALTVEPFATPGTVLIFAAPVSVLSSAQHDASLDPAPSPAADEAKQPSKETPKSDVQTATAGEPASSGWEATPTTEEALTHCAPSPAKEEAHTMSSDFQNDIRRDLSPRNSSSNLTRARADGLLSTDSQPPTEPGKAPAMGRPVSRQPSFEYLKRKKAAVAAEARSAAPAIAAPSNADDEAELAI